MTARSFDRGNPISFIDGEWVFDDDGVSTSAEARPCPRCGRMPTPEGYDACLGYVEGATSVCCGHGVEKGHVFYEDKSQ